MDWIEVHLNESLMSNIRSVVGSARSDVAMHVLDSRAWSYSERKSSWEE